MRKKPIRPRRKPKHRDPGTVTPPVLVNRICRPARRKVPGAPTKRPPARRRKTGLTVGLVRGEVRAVGIWIEHLRQLMAAVRPRRKVLAKLKSGDRETPPPPPMVGRVCELDWPEIRAMDLVAFLKALREQVNALDRQLGRARQDLVLTRPTRRKPVR